MKKNVLIVGSSKNVGKYLYNNLSKENNFILSSRDKAIKANNYHPCDFTNYKKVNSFFKKINKDFKHLNTIIFTIGDSKKNKTKNITKNTYHKFEQNFLTFFNLLENYCNIYNYKKTKIIVFSSVVTERVILDAPAEYVAFKSALKAYVEYKAKELAKYKICINLISPGNILIEGNNWSERLRKNKKKTKDYLKKNVPLNTFISADLILKTCEYLMNDDTFTITGSNFVIDGGQKL